MFGELVDVILVVRDGTGVARHLIHVPEVPLQATPIVARKLANTRFVAGSMPACARDAHEQCPSPSAETSDGLGLRVSDYIVLAMEYGKPNPEAHSFRHDSFIEYGYVIPGHPAGPGINSIFLHPILSHYQFQTDGEQVWPLDSHHIFEDTLTFWDRPLVHHEPARIFIAAALLPKQFAIRREEVADKFPKVHLFSENYNALREDVRQRYPNNGELLSAGSNPISPPRQ